MKEKTKEDLISLLKRKEGHTIAITNIVNLFL